MSVSGNQACITSCPRYNKCFLHWNLKSVASETQSCYREFEPGYNYELKRRPGHFVRYCKKGKAIFDSYRNLRQSFDEIEAEEGARRPNFLPRSTPSPTRDRSPISRFRLSSPYRRPGRSPSRKNEEN
ncbi:hypothetical protein TNCT_70671 [Trichonephila clavata]|uniref:Uncharacterized protein n=1 Tax=Trichonephila clavata TaxID=2740835 RepID=A0A8X6LYA0_TRICU|nr:hypothetical protein TNCT_70671 [Trichonephila clavata]